jgi:DNA-directed RNA polymerase subunit E'/Rpb7
MTQIEQVVLFEEKAHLSPKDMNRALKESIDTILLEHIREKLENRCSAHGFVVPRSCEILSRSAGQIENGRFTGNIVFHCQIQSRVYNPANGTRITGSVLKKNKMGLYIVYMDAIRILVPRDLHIGNEEFENVQIGDTIEIEIRKSRFQIRDQFILSVGVYLGNAGSTDATSVSESPDKKSKQTGETEEDDELLEKMNTIPL